MATSLAQNVVPFAASRLPFARQVGSGIHSLVGLACRGTSSTPVLSVDDSLQEGPRFRRTHWALKGFSAVETVADKIDPEYPVAAASRLPFERQVGFGIHSLVGLPKTFQLPVIGACRGTSSAPVLPVDESVSSLQEGLRFRRTHWALKGFSAIETSADEIGHESPAAVDA